jgi:cytoskeleton protein RodZ
MTDTQQVEDVVADASVVASLGAVLQAARNEKKLSQQDVSDSLRYSVKQIDALERDAFDLLPDAMITRGFIRNYARLLEIDAAPLLDIYRQLSPTQTPNHLGVNASMQPVQLTKDNKPWLVYILGSILVLFFLLAWFVYLEYLPEQFKLPENEAQQSTTSTTDQPVDAQHSLEMPLPEVALPAAERQSDDAPLAAEDATMTSQTVEGQQSQPTPQVNMQSQQVTPLPIAEPIIPAKSESAIKSESQVKVESKASALTAKKVSMAVTEETWVRVSDKTGQILYESTLNAGDTQLLSFQPPFNVIIGNAKAATVNVSGQAVDLAGYTRNNIARISLE